MIKNSRRIFAAAAILCAMWAPAHAQKTKAQLNTEIGSNFPDNTTGQITPQNLRTVTQDIVNSIMPTAPVTANSVPCFDGTTGLLKVCGSGVLTVQNLNTIRFSSQYGQGDWCANLIAALADLGTSPGTIFIDSNQDTVNCSAVSTINIGADKRIQFVSGNIFQTSQTIQLGRGSSLIGTGGGPTYSGTNVSGTIIRWIGASSGDVVAIMNAQHARVADIQIDCNTVSDCAPLHYDSTNTPNSTQNTIENVTLTGGHYGLLVGNRGTSHPTPAQCGSNPNQSGCYEMDFLTFRNFQIFGYCADVNAVGIHVNSFWALQHSTIGPGNIQCANIGIRNVFSGGQNTTIYGVNGGSVIGTNPVLFQTDSGGATGYNFILSESEGGWTYALHDSGCSGSATNTVLLQANGWNDPVLIDGCQIINSVSNVSTSTLSVTGSGYVNSIGDVGTWNASAGGTAIYFPSASRPLPASVGGTGLAGLGAGVSTWLGTPSSANLAAAITDETGSGSAVFASSPNLVTPTIGTATYTALKNTANNLAPVTVEQAGGDLLALRFGSAQPRLVLGTGGGSGSPFIGSNLVFSSGNSWNFDKTAPAWWIGNVGGASGAFYACTNTGTAGASAGTSGNTGCGFMMTTTGGVDIGGTVVPTLTRGELGFDKISASGSAPGAGSAKLAVVAGTNAGTCKLVMYAGTSTTPTTIIDNVGGGC